MSGAGQGLGGRGRRDSGSVSPRSVRYPSVVLTVVPEPKFAPPEPVC